MDADSRILEFCGFKVFDFEEKYWGGKMSYYVSPDGGIFFDRPVLDMNFLVKYVVPKLDNCDWNYAYDSFSPSRHLFILDGCSGMNTDPNKAWQEALIKRLDNSKEGGGNS